MPLQTSGTITLAQIQTEFGGSNPIALNEYYRGGGLVPNTAANANIPTSGQIALSNFYGGSKSVTTIYDTSQATSTSRATATSRATTTGFNTTTVFNTTTTYVTSKNTTTIFQTFEEIYTTIKGDVELERISFYDTSRTTATSGSTAILTATSNITATSRGTTTAFNTTTAYNTTTSFETSRST